MRRRQKNHRHRHRPQAVLADTGRRLADALRGGGADQVTVVLPGDEPLECRVFVCRDAEEAAACLQRHYWGREGPEPVTEFNYQHEAYLRARDEAFARSNGRCQFCGLQPATEAHHWAVHYPPAHETTADDLTALCAACHLLATTLRRFTRAGGSRHQFSALFTEAISRCDWNSPLPESPPSSRTTERPDSTREALSAARSQRSRRSEAATALKSTSSGSESSSVVGPSISELTTDPRYRKQRFGP